MPKKRPKKRHPPKRHTSSLADHKKVGRELRPPILAMGGAPMTFINWQADHLPDQIWVCSWLAAEGKRGMVALARLLDFAGDAVRDHVSEMPPEWVLNGTLTSFEALPTKARSALIDKLHEADIYEDFVPEGMAHALGLYPGAPGRWLIQPWLDRGIRIDPDAGRTWLSEAVTAGMDSRGEVATMAKGVYFRQMLAAGRISFSESISFIKLLPRYPLETTDDESKHVESNIRAMYNALAQGDPGDWPKTFWRSNWRLFNCLRPELPEQSARSSSQPDDLTQFIEATKRRSEDLWADFDKVAAQTDPDLYDPDRFEVLTGMVGRVLRYIQSFVLTPPMWTMENGAPLLRALVETEIVCKYLVSQEATTPLYAKFKAYGMGKIKLLKLHIEDHIDSIDTPPEGLTDYAEYLGQVLNRERFEEFQAIDLGGSFAGVDMRRMSQVVGMETEYRFLFAPASSNVHGEWGVIDENVFTTCRNPLHRYHRIVADPRPW